MFSFNIYVDFTLITSLTIGVLPFSQTLISSGHNAVIKQLCGEDIVGRERTV